VTLRRLLVSLAAAVVLTVAVPPVVASAQTAAAPPLPAVTRIERCIEDRRELLVQFLIDESKSLRISRNGSGTDPEARRVEAADAALVGMARLADATDTKVWVDLAGFASDFVDYSGWQSLSGATLGQVQGALGEFRGRDDGDETDYANALDGAQRSLAEQRLAVTRPGRPAPCKLLLWFTDGQLSVDGRSKAYAPGVRDSDRVEDRAVAFICSEGLVEQMRRDGIVTVAVALSSPASPLQPAAFDLLTAIAAGSSPIGTCGADGSVETGVAIQADDLDQLIEIFARIGTLGATRDGEKSITPVCVGSPCPEGARQFVVEPWMGRFNLLAGLSVDGASAQIRAPDGSVGGIPPKADSRSGSLVVADTKVEYVWLGDRSLVVDGRPESTTAKWPGTWTITYVAGSPGARASTQVSVFGGLTASVADGTVLRLGEANTVDVRVSPASGVPWTSPSLPERSVLTATLVDPQTGVRRVLTVEPVPGRLQYKVTDRTPLDSQSGTALLELDLDITTRAGLTVRSSSAGFEVPVLPPVNYPTLRPEVLRFPPLEGSEPAVLTVTATAGDRDGCVWVDRRASEFDGLPRDVGTVRVSSTPARYSQTRCLQVPAGQSRKLRVALTPDAAGEGLATGTVAFGLSVDGEPEVVVQALQTEVQMTRPVDEATRWALVAVLMLIGIGLPLLILWLVVRWQARFAATRNIRMVSIPARVTSSDVSRREGDRNLPLDVDPERDVQWFQPQTQKPASQIEVASSPRLSLRTVKPRHPFGYPDAVVTAGGDVLISSEGAPSGDDESVARVPLTLPGTWVFVRSGAPTATADGEVRTVDGHLVLFLANQGFFQQVDRLSAQARDRLPTAWDRLARPPAEPEGIEPPPDPGGPGPDEPPWSAPSTGPVPSATAGTAPPFGSSPPPAPAPPAPAAGASRPDPTPAPPPPDPGGFEPPPWE
jgi:hypothetical protein